MVPPNGPIAIAGYACRLPGASSPATFWQVLVEGRCTISDVPTGRWPVGRFLHPRASEPGFAYTAAGGYIDDPFGFDAAAFGISPREAQQMDPQQRLLLEVVWEALEDAGIPPSRLAGEAVGVYVGASNVDYQSAASLDLASMESHFMTGNSLSIASNRISHVFDWRGPSFTVDSACSSSFVAAAQALAALQAGVIETAVVAGVNMLLSPAPYVGFSRARMLSPTGRCRPFSAAADGYVRSEGAVALVLRRADVSRQGRARALVVGAGVNSDGRTVGIALPSAEGQRALLERVYADAGVAPASLAFVEAHGTGTRVGDPAEASAIGDVLGRPRSTPLPLGSAKSNVGHLESASGVVGLLKAVLALEHNLYPPTLHLSELNPDIDFAALNLAPATEAVALEATAGPLFAGICNYGFGGTNAHLVIRQPDPLTPAETTSRSPARMLLLSAHTREALAAVARDLAAVMTDDTADLDLLARAAAHQRERWPVRAALPLTEPARLRSSLASLADGMSKAAVEGRTPTAAPGKLAFVYSGNGAQWAGMARAALARSPAFRRQLQRVDASFARQGGWSLVAALSDANLGERIGAATTAQPLLFGIQAALTGALAEYGVKPDLVIGHSIGEAAAALACGALSLDEAVHLILVRSRHQEPGRGMGRMAVLACDGARAAELIARSAESARTAGAADACAQTMLPEIAALNGPSSTTISGPEAAIRAVLAEARTHRIASVLLDLDYPFHSALLDPQRNGVTRALAGLSSRAAVIPFLSTVTGDVLAGEALDAGYWWRNLREPVQFWPALRKALDEGTTHVLEIGPKPLLTGVITDIMAASGRAGAALASLSEADDEQLMDPVLATAARVLVHGGRIAEAELLGDAPVRPVPLASYPWQRQRHVLPRTPDGLMAMGQPFGGPSPHPLLGYRLATGSPEWRTSLDQEAPAFLADHKVDGEVIVPAAALIEMVLAAAREALGEGAVEIADFDILQPLVLPADGMREVSTTLSADGRHVEIRSRRRLGSESWARHARCRVRLAQAQPGLDIPRPGKLATDHDQDEVYRRAREHGLDYGPAFRLVRFVHRDSDTADVLIDAPLAGAVDWAGFALDPTSLDAALHALFLERETVPGETTTYLPVRFGRLWLGRSHVVITRAVLHRIREVGRTSVVLVILFTAEGEIAATVEDLVFRSVRLDTGQAERRILGIDWVPADGPPEAPALPALRGVEPLPPAWRVVQAFALSLAYERAGKAASGLRPPGDEDGLMAHLAANELARCTTNGWQVREAAVDAAEDVARVLVRFHPEASAEVALCAGALAGPGTPLLRDPVAAGSAAVREAFEATSVVFLPAVSFLLSEVAALLQARRGQRPVILVSAPWTMALVRPLAQLAAERRCEVLLAGRSAGSFGTIVEKLGSGIGLRFADLATTPEPIADLAIALAWGQPGEDPAEIGPAAGWLRPRGRFLQVFAQPDLALALLLGAEAVVPADWQAPLARLGFAAQPIEAALEGWTAVETIGPSVADAGQPRLVACRGPEKWTRLFADALTAGGAGRADWQVIDGATLPPEAEVGAAGSLMWLDLSALDPVSDPVEGLSSRILGLRDILRTLDAMPGDRRLWIVTRGACAASPLPDAVALQAFGRVAINEFPSIDLRLLDLDPALAPGDAAARVAAVLAEPGREREWAVGPDGARVPRARRGPAQRKAVVDDAHRTSLAFRQAGKLASAEWEAVPRVAPGAGQVEIAVTASGLNFRDVMLGMGLLDEDLLGHGLSQAALGFEMAGTVLRTGPGVRHLKPGDPVLGFARAAFASHVTLAAEAVAPVPAGLSLEAAATIPVAFCTAWYALVMVARLRPGETVLVHGAAGGVGMAAIQVALARGARVLATAGTEGRRMLAQLVGAEQVFDSRSLAFAEEIRERFGGVDVVLNSLAGEAMLQGVRLVRPFGRFVELGKRDYLDNTSLDLRPFLRNVGYFGVDLDEFLGADPEGAARLLREVLAGFENGEFAPLPYRVFDADSVVPAFRLMQGSGHVGKILLRPATSGVLPRPIAGTPFQAPQGPILLVGGTAGFGFETACWLAGQGARTLVLASRRGQVEPSFQPRVDELRNEGVTVAVETVDVTDAASVRAFVDRAVKRFGPIAGAVHTAMVLEDGLIEGLDEAALSSVLAPKVRGILALEAALAGQPLALFLAFSSATTLIGSPGQGAYVAANAFLEGVMARRRAAGLPGLAVAWGAIEGAGVLADRADLGERLRRTTGVSGLPVSDALEHLGRILADPVQSGPVAYVSEMATTDVADRLALLRSPGFEALRASASRGRGQAGGEDGIALRIRSAGPQEALDLALDMLAAEIGAILQLPAKAIEPRRPLHELGMDSLMALELRFEVEKRCGADLPLVSIAGLTVRDLAEKLVGILRPAGTDDDLSEEKPGTEALQALRRAHAAEAEPPADIGKIGREVEERLARTGRLM